MKTLWRNARATTALVGGLLLTAQAQALQIVSFSPQGEVAGAPGGGQSSMRRP